MHFSYLAGCGCHVCATYKILAFDGIKSDPLFDLKKVRHSKIALECIPEIPAIIYNNLNYLHTTDAIWSLYL